jgi:Condensation domain
VASIPISFAGDHGGEEELTWGQQMVWEQIQHTGSSLHMSGVTALAEGTTIEDVVAKWRFVMSRYEAVRTRMRLCPGERPRQVVAVAGEIPLEVVEAGDADPAEVAGAVRAQFEATDFDYAREWPLRLAVVLRDGVPTHDVATLCHLVTDGAGALVLLADVAGRDPRTGRAGRAVSPVEPLALARQQATPELRRRSEAALRYWAGHLRTMPARRFGPSPDPRRPRCWQAGFGSPATDRAVRLVAARHGIDTAPVLQAAVAVALARVTGVTPVVTQVLVNNRFRPGLAEMVGQVAMWGLCVVDVAETTVEEAVLRTWRAAIATYKNSYYDRWRLDRLVAEVDRERGEEVDLSCYFNDRRMLGQQDGAGPVPTAGEVSEALSAGRFRWGEPSDRAWNRLLIVVNPVPETVDIDVFADTHHVSPAQLEALVRGVETAAVQAALAPRTPTVPGRLAESGAVPG